MSHQASINLSDGKHDLNKPTGNGVSMEGYRFSNQSQELYHNREVLHQAVIQDQNKSQNNYNNNVNTHYSENYELRQNNEARPVERSKRRLYILSGLFVASLCAIIILIIILSMPGSLTICKSPSIPQNSTLLNPNTEYKEGDEAVFQCQVGFEPVISDNHILTCSSSGQWEGTPLVCIPITTCAEPDIPRGSYLLNYADNYEIGFEAVFQCITDYVPVVAEDYMIKCNSSGQWEGTSLLCLIYSEHQYDFDYPDIIDRNDLQLTDYNPTDPNDDYVLAPSPWTKAANLSEYQHLVVVNSKTTDGDNEACPWDIQYCINEQHPGVTLSMIVKTLPGNHTMGRISSSSRGVAFELHEGRFHVHAYKSTTWAWTILLNDIIEFDIWTHWCATWSIRNGLILYQNGTEIAKNITGAVADTRLNPENVVIGSGDFVGMVDNVGYYADEFSPEQVQELYNYYFNVLIYE